MCELIKLTPFLYMFFSDKIFMCDSECKTICEFNWAYTDMMKMTTMWQRNLIFARWLWCSLCLCVERRREDIAVIKPVFFFIIHSHKMKMNFFKSLSGDIRVCIDDWSHSEAVLKIEWMTWKWINFSLLKSWTWTWTLNNT